MSRASCKARRLVAALVAASALSFVALPAHAQLRGIIRRAAKSAATDSSKGTSDALGPELTDATLASTLKGLHAVAAKGDQRDALRAQQDQLQNKLNADMQKHQNDQSAFDLATQKAEQCQSAFFDKRSEEHRQKLQANAYATAAKASSPQATQDAMKYNQQLQAAMQKNDTVAVKRIQQEMADNQMKTLGVDLHADTADAIKACGAKPAKPQWLVDDDAMRAQISKNADQLRDLERDMELEGVQASGMTAAQFGLARERVLTWWQSAQSGRPGPFSARENQLLQSHKSDIQQVSKVL